MSLESGDYINDLVKTNPAPTDLVNQGDDHLKLVKKVLKQTFPGSGGQGFNKAITASETELNYVDGVTAPIQEQFNGLSGSYVETDGGPQEIKAQLTVAERVVVKANTDSDFDGYEVVDSGGATKAFFAYDEPNDYILIGHRTPSDQNETVLIVNDGKVKVLSDVFSTVPTSPDDLANKKYVDDNSGGGGSGYPTSIPYPTPGNNYTYAVAPTRMQVTNEVSVVAELNAPTEFSGFSIYTPDSFNFNKPQLHGAFAYDDNLKTLSIYQGDDATGGASDTVAEFKAGNIKVWSGNGQDTNPSDPLHLVNLQYLQANYSPGVFSVNGTAGASGTFEDNNGNTVTVLNGLITSLS